MKEEKVEEKTGFYLQHSDVWVSVRAVATSVLGDVFEPLDVRLGVAIHLADEAGVLTNMHGGVGREASLKDGPVG